MLCLVAFWACLSTLPDAGSIPTIGLDGSCSVVLQNGTAWVRILEDDYVFLRVSATPGVSLTAFDAQESVLAQATPGQSLVLSAYNDYWFYIRLEGTSSGPVTVSAVEEPLERLTTASSVSGSLSLSNMGRCYRFVVPSDGLWEFDVRSPGKT